MKLLRNPIGRRTGILLAVIACALGWNTVHESPDEMVERLGGKVVREYRGPEWAAKLPAIIGDRVMRLLSTPKCIYARGTPLTDEDVRNIASLRHLTVLTLDNTSITDTALTDISRLRNLTRLDLDGTQITDEGLRELAGMPSLASLDLSDTRVTDRGIAHLAALPQLKRLYLARTDVTGAALPLIAEFARLEYLDLSGTKIQDDDLSSLRKSLVMTLKLADTQITDAGIAHLRNAARISDMNLARTRITDQSFREFEKFPTLQWVTVSVTDVGITVDEMFEFCARDPRISMDVESDP